MIYQGITYVVPCGAGKLDHAAPARDLYTGSMFRHALTNVERLASMDEQDGRPARVLILSGLHGLVELDTVLEPYEQRIDKPGAVTVEQLTEQARAFGIDWDPAGSAQVYAFLPKAYLAKLDAALRELDVYVQDVYEGTASIGEQRRVCSIVGRRTFTGGDEEQSGAAGPRIWVGGGVYAFGWDTEILVSYGRLREASTLPVATKPWVLDSRAFKEIDDHGTWTISPEQYAADVRRYAQEIGLLEWVAPQDWPAAAHLLERTGLSEHEHQARTIESVKTLRRMLPDQDVLTVVTGKTLDGYLRHIDMYARAGIDLRAENIVVGVGALVGRSDEEAADIIRALYAAGLTRLHGFGIKGRVLDLVGALLESVDSSSWSVEARHRAGECPHGLVKWERNCPHYARTWAAEQRVRAANSQVQQALPLWADTPAELPV